MPQNFTRQGTAMLFSVNDHYPVNKDVINSLGNFLFLDSSADNFPRDNDGEKDW